MQSAEPQQQSFDEPFARVRRPASYGSAEKQAHMVLDDEGTIQHVSERARSLLDLSTHTVTGESFFGYVHPRQLTRVLRDLTEMTTGDKQRASWLIRLQTGVGARQWFKVKAENRLDDEERPAILLRLFERGSGYRRP